MSRSKLGAASVILSVAYAMAASSCRGEPAGAATKSAGSSGYVVEAPLPEGFPPPDEPGVVVEKQYPRARAYSATGDGAFFKCFAYLTKQRHEMTAPVVMDYDEPADAKSAKKSDEPPIKRMSFLLEQAELDRPHVEGNVRVADLPAMRVLSVAFRGAITQAAVAEGEAKIRARLAETPRSVADGEFRILGYNSPMIPREKNTWELQLPIRQREGGRKDAAADPR